MAQIGWTYLDDQGGRHKVGLYHGDKSGHLVIYCNMRVVQVDFNVKESCDYSFFIEEELCEVHLVKESIGFSYAFSVNKDADTPHNRNRKQTDKRNLVRSGLFLGSGLAVVLLLFFGIRAYNRHQQALRYAATGINSQPSPETEARLQKEGRTATARLFFMKDAQQRRLIYAFETEENQRIGGSLAVPDTGRIILPTGFVLEDRDEFSVTYLPFDPKIHRIRFDQPTSLQIQTYQRLAALAEQITHPDKTPRGCVCLCLVATGEKGWRTLADIYWQSTPPTQNKEHNHDSYLRLIRDVDVDRALKKSCWQE